MHYLEIVAIDHGSPARENKTTMTPQWLMLEMMELLTYLKDVNGMENRATYLVTKREINLSMSALAFQQPIIVSNRYDAKYQIINTSGGRIRIENGWFRGFLETS